MTSDEFATEGTGGVSFGDVTGRKNIPIGFTNDFGFEEDLPMFEAREPESERFVLLGPRSSCALRFILAVLSKLIAVGCGSICIPFGSLEDILENLVFISSFYYICLFQQR